MSTMPTWDPRTQLPLRQWLVGLTDYPSGKTALRTLLRYARDEELHRRYRERTYWLELAALWCRAVAPAEGTRRNYQSWALTALGLAIGKGRRAA